MFTHISLHILPFFLPLQGGTFSGCGQDSGEFDGFINLFIFAKLISFSVHELHYSFGLSANIFYINCNFENYRDLKCMVDVL